MKRKINEQGEIILLAIKGCLDDNVWIEE